MYIRKKKEERKKKQTSNDRFVSLPSMALVIKEIHVNLESEKIIRKFIKIKLFLMLKWPV